MKVVQPIIIVGSGRCGSTVFHGILATHPQVMWLSGLCDRHPVEPAWNQWTVRAMGNPLIRRMLGRRVQPGECYRFWDHHAFGFSQPCRDLVKDDVTVRARHQVRSAFEAMLTPQRDRLLLKITGWPRIGYLSEIFDDAKFIHIVRDGRAVASSLLHVDFWAGWGGPQHWRAGLLSAEDQAAWESYDRSFVALAGLEWKIQMRAMEAARQKVSPEAFLEIKYETFCDQPLETCRRVLEFVGLPQSTVLERSIRTGSIRNSDRWRKDLTPAQQAILDDMLQPELRRYGYISQSEQPLREHQFQSLTGRLTT